MSFIACSYRVLLLFHCDFTQSDGSANWAVLDFDLGVELIDRCLSEDAEHREILLGSVMMELVFQGTESWQACLVHYRYPCALVFQKKRNSKNC